MSKVKVHIGNIDDMGRRFVDAWHRAEKGDTVNENNLTFYSLETLLSTLTPKRMALLKTVHRTGKTTIKALAESVGRDYKNVHQDVTACSTPVCCLRKMVVSPRRGMRSRQAWFCNVGHLRLVWRLLRR